MSDYIPALDVVGLLKHGQAGDRDSLRDYQEVWGLVDMPPENCWVDHDQYQDGLGAGWCPRCGASVPEGVTVRV